MLQSGSNTISIYMLLLYDKSIYASFRNLTVRNYFKIRTFSFWIPKIYLKSKDVRELNPLPAVTAHQSLKFEAWNRDYKLDAKCAEKLGYRTKDYNYVAVGFTFNSGNERAMRVWRSKAQKCDNHSCSNGNMWKEHERKLTWKQLWRILTEECDSQFDGDALISVYRFYIFKAFNFWWWCQSHFSLFFISYVKSLK